MDSLQSSKTLAMVYKRILCRDIAHFIFEGTEFAVRVGVVLFYDRSDRKFPIDFTLLTDAVLS